MKRGPAEGASPPAKTARPCHDDSTPFTTVPRQFHADMTGAVEEGRRAGQALVDQAIRMQAEHGERISEILAEHRQELAGQSERLSAAHAAELTAIRGQLEKERVVAVERVDREARVRFEGAIDEKVQIQKALDDMAKIKQSLEADLKAKTEELNLYKRQTQQRMTDAATRSAELQSSIEAEQMVAESGRQAERSC